jgi:hypothetical protein
VVKQSGRRLFLTTVAEIVMLKYSYCYVCSVLCILFHCVVLCTVCVSMFTVPLPLSVNPIAVDKIYRIK